MQGCGKCVGLEYGTNMSQTFRLHVFQGLLSVFQKSKQMENWVYASLCLKLAVGNAACEVTQDKPFARWTVCTTKKVIFGLSLSTADFKEGTLLENMHCAPFSMGSWK